MSTKPRLLVAALSLSASAFIGLAVHENYTDRAIIPTKGDVPTVGFGSTYHEDGSRVKMGDRTNPVNALKKAQAHISKEEKIFRDSLPGVHLNQDEYDLYMDWVYQYGTGNWYKPKSPRTALLQGQYKEACDALLNWRFVNGYDCSTVINGQRNRICWGVWTRQLERQTNCYTAGGFQ